MLDKVERNELLNACLSNQTDFFKKMRKTKPSFSEVIDGKSENIPECFASKYKQLYNSTNDEVELSCIKDNIYKDIRRSDISEVSKITPSIVKEA